MSLYGYSVTSESNAPTVNVTMKQFETALCTKYRDDPYSCIDCDHSCPKGQKAVAQLEKDTQKKQMNTRRKGAATMKISAMTSYVEAMSSPDPVAFVKEKYGIDNDRTAKNKIYQWQHNYGTNLPLIREKIKLIQDEIAAFDTQTNKVSPEEKKPEIAPKTPVIQEEKKMTKRQEEKISQSRLEQMRLDLEAEYLKAESDIETYKKEIENCEKRMTEITDQINAIRQVLEIFKKKDALFV